ncbi:MAG: hypothetical protein ICV64_03575 [Thermoleophilia bacterium]|nr:hypothetical protein [Thermoleophilia bacterium]
MDTTPRRDPDRSRRGADDPDWHPLQHDFGLTAVGINVYRAREAGDVLIARHDETAAGHEELYYLADGRARFVLDDEEHELDAGTTVVVRNSAVVREAVALEPGTTVLAVGGRPDPAFRSSWQAHHFEDVPRVE